MIDAIDENIWKSFQQNFSKLDVAHYMESIVEHTYRLHLKQGDQAIDVGAHRGRHTIPMAETVGFDGKIFAIEAASEMQQKLRATLNHCGVPHIRRIVSYLDCAVSNKSGTAEFYYTPKAGGLSGLERQNYPEGVEAIKEKVSLQRLDDIIPISSKIKYIKLDIEGAEYYALCGAKEIIWRSRPLITMEYGAKGAAQIYGYEAEEYFDLMDDIDYVWYTIFGGEYTRKDLETSVPYYLFAAPREQGNYGASVLHRASLAATASFFGSRLPSTS